jgi:hypothetical protein
MCLARKPAERLGVHARLAFISRDARRLNVCLQEHVVDPKSRIAQPVTKPLFGVRCSPRKALLRQFAQTVTDSG